MYILYVHVFCYCVPLGYCNVDNIGDKLSWWIQRTRPSRTQYTIYSLEPMSILYQEMLNRKATQMSDSFRNTQSMSDDSEFEIIGREYSNASSDITSSYYSDCIPSPPIMSKSDHNPNTVPVTIEFHPATPIDGATVINVDDGNSNETYLALQDDSVDVELKNVFSSCHDQTSITPEPSSNSDFVSVSLEEESSFHTPDIADSSSDILRLSLTQDKLSSNGVIAGLETNNNKPSIGVSLADDDLSISAHTDSDSPLPLNVTDDTDSTEANTSTDLTSIPPREPSPFRSGGMFMDPSHSGPFLVPPESMTVRKTMIDRGRSVTPEQRGIPKSSSWMNLTGGSIEMLQFTTTSISPTAKNKTHEIEQTPPSKNSVIRSVPWSAVSSLQ